jgi:hypothetical protein
MLRRRLRLSEDEPPSACEYLTKATRKVVLPAYFQVLERRQRQIRTARLNPNVCEQIWRARKLDYLPHGGFWPEGSIAKLEQKRFEHWQARATAIHNGRQDKLGLMEQFIWSQALKAEPAERLRLLVVFDEFVGLESKADSPEYEIECGAWSVIRAAKLDASWHNWARAAIVTYQPAAAGGRTFTMDSPPSCVGLAYSATWPLVGRLHAGLESRSAKGPSPSHAS